MESHELLQAFRCDVVDDVAPYLWSSGEVYNYINDAYYMFVRMTGGIPDGSSDVTTLTALAGEATTPIDPSIMRVRTAKNVTDNNRPMTVINVQDEDVYIDDDYGLLRTMNLSDTPGTVRYMILGEEDDYVRWVKIPDVDTTVKLVVERLPMIPITRAQQLFSGVRVEHHYHLLKWVRHLAYRKQDADTFNLVKSDEERNDFIAYCDMAMKEKATRKHKVRVTGYGGI
jgi:hypothetical protein